MVFFRRLILKLCLNNKVVVNALPRKEINRYRLLTGEPLSNIRNLDQFRDSVSRDKRFTNPVGRNWTVSELRRKSFSDLHKLWYVLYKERNILLTESYICRVKALHFPQVSRFQMVKKSMAAIKVVLGERKRDKIAKRISGVERKVMS